MVAAAHVILWDNLHAYAVLSTLGESVDEWMARVALAYNCHSAEGHASFQDGVPNPLQPFHVLLAVRDHHLHGAVGPAVAASG